MAITSSQSQNITSPNGNSLAVFVDGVTGILTLKDVNGKTEPLSNYVCGGGGTNPLEYNANSTGIQPILGSNTASGFRSIVGGGSYNTASCSNTTIGGGFCNINSGLQATIGGGSYNTASCGEAIIGGGGNNIVSTNPEAFIIGNGTLSQKSNLLFASGSTVQITGSLNLSSSFAPQYRNIGSVSVLLPSSGILLSQKDYNVTFHALAVGAFNKNAIQLPANLPTGTVMYLQRTSGSTACTISGSSGHTINNSAGYTFPITLYARRMFVFTGTGWFTEPNPIA
jgi:hypothetical protein